MVAAKGNGLGRKLIARILLANALLSVLASSMQLYTSYQRDHSQVLGLITIIDDSFRTGFQDALWEYNFPLVEALLEGIYNKSDVEYVRLTTSSGRVWELGGQTPAGTDLSTLNFNHENDAGVSFPVGQLSIGLTLEHIRARAWSQLWTLLVSNFTKTILACIIMLMLFDHRISRHLKWIATQVSATSWPDSREVIRLDRPGTSVPDDLDQIVQSINAAKQKSHDDFDVLRSEIRRRKSAETMLKQRSEALEEAKREQAEFTYAISHDLKAPANTIAMLLAELRLTEGDRLSEDGDEILDDAGRTVSRMTALVEDVLGYARTVESGMEIDDVDLNVLASEVVEDLRGDVAKTSAEISLSGLPEMQGSRVQLRLLLQNLISNAIKFRDPARAPRVQVRGLAVPGADIVGFAVEDNGIGIAPEFHEKVFGLFQRLHSHSDYAGSGLGLTLCKRIVTNHAGQITLSSRPGQGTRFEVWLPRRRHGQDN